MAVGQFVTKQTWLLGDVEIRGVVSVAGATEGDNVGARDDFDITPDHDYQHLVALIPGAKGLMHCETYPLPPEHVNRQAPWPLPRKDDGAVFEVRDPVTGVRRPLKVGDHVRLVGRWTIDHHPETCVTRQRGWLRVGCVWPELHPFDWEDITLVTQPPATGEERATLSLAAPLHEESYLGNGKWFANEVAGVASKVFVSDDGANYHDTVTAHLRVAAPPLPAGWTGDPGLLSVDEVIATNGTGQPPDAVRTITRRPEAIEVDATVTAPATQQLGGGIAVGDVNDPANGRSVFQARYAVSWRLRLDAAAVDVKLSAPATTTEFEVAVENIGPDAVTITSAELSDPAAFALLSGVAATVPGHQAVRLRCRFTPPSSGHYRSVLRVHSNDPSGKTLLVPLSGSTSDLTGRLEVLVRPTRIRLGTATEITIITRDGGSGTPVDGTASILNYSASGRPEPFQVPTNQPFTRTLRKHKEFDPETKTWDFEEPGGDVSVPGYERDPNTRIPFEFR